MMDFLEKEFFGNTLLDYIATFLIIIAGLIVIFVLKAYVIGRIEKKEEEEKTRLDKLLLGTLGKILLFGLAVGVIYLSIQHLKLNESFTKVINVSGIIIFTLLGIRFLISIINYVVVRYWLEKIDDDAKRRSLKSLMPIVKIIIYSLGVFFLLDNLGFKVSTLLAGLGIGGVAVALAGQAILGDLFSYFAILFDKPFQLGDFIIVGEHLGVVEHIGVKTTRIRSLSGEQLVFSNTDLTSSRVRNYKRMEERRVAFKIGVVYQTPVEKLKEVPGLVKNIIDRIEDTRFDRTHFFQYGDFSLNYEIVYYIFGADYNKYMDVQQRINLEIYEEFHKRGIEFAYPTQTLFLEREAK